MLFSHSFHSVIIVCVYFREPHCVDFSTSCVFFLLFLCFSYTPHTDIVCMFVLRQCLYYTLVLLSVFGYTCRMQRDEMERKSSLTSRMENTINRDEHIDDDEQIYSTKTEKSVHRKTAAAVAVRCSSFCCHRRYIQYIETTHGDWSSVIFRSPIWNPNQPLSHGKYSQFDGSREFFIW